MGMNHHHGIIVTSQSKASIYDAHALAKSTFGEIFVGPIIQSKYNEHVSFYVPSDGSGEGKRGSIDGDKKRATFYALMRENVAAHIYEVVYGSEIAPNSIKQIAPDS